MKNHISQKGTWKYDIFCIFGKDDISFSYKYNITFLSKKAKTTFSRKTHLTFPVSLKKMIFILENIVFSGRKIKDDEIHIGRTSVINLNKASKNVW